MAKDDLVGKGFESRPEDINRAGRPKGSQNRNTIARKVLAYKAIIPDKLYDKLKEYFPDLDKATTAEELMSLAVAYRAIKKSEQGYKNVMDSAYGAPKQEIDMTSDGERINPTVTIINSTVPLSGSEKDVQLDK